MRSPFHVQSRTLVGLSVLGPLLAACAPGHIGEPPNEVLGSEEEYFEPSCRITPTPAFAKEPYTISAVDLPPNAPCQLTIKDADGSTTTEARSDDTGALSLVHLTATSGAAAISIDTTSADQTPARAQCYTDVFVRPKCGNGRCEPGEDCATCVGDCGTCGPTCGDGSCDPGEDCGTCAGDCGACPTTCVPSCVGKSCGSDGCGGMCGTCSAGLCSASGQCGGWPTKTFAVDVYPILQAAKCSSCHDSGEKPTLTTASTAYANLVGVPSGCGGKAFVTPNQIDASYLVNKLTGVGMCSGARMPKGRTALTTAQIDIIRAWIATGASF